MLKARLKRSNIKNQSGLLTVDFLFGIIITFSVMLFLFRISFSLVMVEVAQYISFSVARSHSAGDKDLLSQRLAAEDKFKQLLNNPEWKNLFKNAFEIGNNGQFNNSYLKSGLASVDGVDGGGHFEDYLYDESNDGHQSSGPPFVGTVIPLKITWFNTKLPLIGNTSENDQEFKTKVTGFIIREPSQFECHDFLNKKYEKMIELDSARFNHPSIRRGLGEYIRMEDNGC